MIRVVPNSVYRKIWKWGKHWDKSYENVLGSMNSRF